MSDKLFDYHGNHSYSLFLDQDFNIVEINSLDCEMNYLNEQFCVINYKGILADCHAKSKDIMSCISMLENLGYKVTK